MSRRPTVCLLALVLVCVLPLAARKPSPRTPAQTVVTTPLQASAPAYSRYFQEALQAKAMGQYAEAFELFKFCLSLDSTQAAAYSELADFYQGMQQTAKALEYYEKACQLDEDNEWYALQLAAACREDKRIYKAINLLKKTVKDHPEKYELYYHISDMYIQLKDYKSALKALEQFETFTGPKEELSLQKYRLYLSMDQPKKALKEMERLCRTQPDNQHYRVLLAHACMENKQPATAYDLLTDVKSQDPDNGEALIFLADYYEQQGQTDAMMQEMTDLVERPGVSFEHKMYTLMYLLGKQSDDSVLIQHSFDRILEQYPEEYAIHEQYVRWLLQHGEKEKAREELRNVLDMNPNQLEVWKDYLSLYFETNDYRQIRAICQQARNYFPEEAAFWYYDALTYAIEQQYDQAVDTYLTCLQKTDPANKALVSQILGYLGDIFHQKGDEQQAFDYYNRALAENPSNVLTLNNYAYYLSQKGEDLERAEIMSRQSLRADPNNSTYLDTYAWILFKQGKYEMARIYIERALISNTSDADANAEMGEHYGDILWFCGQQDAARLEWQKALRLSENPSEKLIQKTNTGTYVE